jgi:hypothetical protein
MQVLIIRNTVAGGQAVEIGQVIDLPDEEAGFLVRLGKASTEVPAPKRKARED